MVATRKSLSETAYRSIRQLIVRLELAPGAVVREDLLQIQLGIGRTPIREALQRLARDQFLVVIPRRGMIVGNIDVADLTVVYETRAILEPYAARVACARGRAEHWAQLRHVLSKAHQPGITAQQQIDLDAQCHQIVWQAGGNRFLIDTLDVLYAQSDRLWHMYLPDVTDMGHALDEHEEILQALVAGDAELAYNLTEKHVRSFDTQVRRALTKRLELERVQ